MIPHCGKCDSTMVYRDDDPVTRAKNIACLKCGNRWPGGVEFYMDEKREGNMKGKCRNCERVLTIVSDHCCYVCYHAGKGLEGEQKDAALEAAKKRIQSGGLMKVGRRRKSTDTDVERIVKEAPADLRRKALPPEIIERVPDPLPPGIPADIPLTIRLTIEVGIRLVGTTA